MVTELKANWCPSGDLRIYSQKSNEPKVYTKQNMTLTIYPLTKLVHRSSRMRETLKILSLQPLAGQR